MSDNDLDEEETELEEPELEDADDLEEEDDLEDDALTCHLGTLDRAARGQGAPSTSSCSGKS